MTGVRTAGEADAGEVGRIFAAGFSDDPVLTWIFREPDQAGKLRAFFDFLAAEELVPLGTTFLLPDSCAAWTPPGTPEWPAERVAGFSAVLDAVCTSAERHRLKLLDDAQKEHHPAGPLWYLGTIGTVPEARGQGFGAALLRHALAIVDEARLPAYLESSNPRNVSLYRRHGFVPTGRIELPDGPALTTMWRDRAA